jgi:hypothetical protein
MKVVEVGTRVSRKNRVGALIDGVVTQVYEEPSMVSVLWRLEEGLLVQAEQLKNLIILSGDHEKEN